MSEQEFKNMVFESYNKRFGDLGDMIAKLEESKNKTNANRDEEFIWQLKSVVEEVESIIQVYLMDGNIFSDYAIENLKHAKQILENSMDYFKSKKD
jgi:predicted ATP-binding protein involved in virulence